MFTAVICSILLITHGVLLILNDLYTSNNNLYEKGFSIWRKGHIMGTLGQHGFKETAPIEE